MSDESDGNAFVKSCDGVCPKLTCDSMAVLCTTSCHTIINTRKIFHKLDDDRDGDVLLFSKKSGR